MSRGIGGGGGGGGIVAVRGGDVGNVMVGETVECTAVGLGISVTII